MSLTTDTSSYQSRNSIHEKKPKNWCDKKSQRFRVDILEQAHFFTKTFRYLKDESILNEQHNTSIKSKIFLKLTTKKAEALIGAIKQSGALGFDEANFKTNILPYLAPIDLVVSNITQILG